MYFIIEYSTHSAFLGTCLGTSLWYPCPILHILAYFCSYYFWFYCFVFYFWIFNFSWLGIPCNMPPEWFPIQKIPKDVFWIHRVFKIHQNHGKYQISNLANSKEYYQILVFLILTVFLDIGTKSISFKWFSAGCKDFEFSVLPLILGGLSLFSSFSTFLAVDCAMFCFCTLVFAQLSNSQRTSWKSSYKGNT